MESGPRDTKNVLGDVVVPSLWVSLYHLRLEHLEAGTLGEPSPTWLWSEGVEPHICQIAKAPTDVRRQVMAGP